MKKLLLALVRPFAWLYLWLGGELKP